MFQLFKVIFLLFGDAVAFAGFLNSFLMRPAIKAPIF